MALNLRFGSEPKLRELAQFGPAYLPAEIFSNIISISCQPETYMYTHMFPLALASVNQSWRSFILDSPSIWASLCVDLSYPVSMHGFQMFLERSGSFPLDIILYDSETVDWPGAPSEPEATLVATLLRALNPEIGRWRSFKLSLINENALCTAISNFRGVAESLKELVVDNRGIPCNDLSRVHKLTFRMAMPTIRHLHLSDVAAGWLIHDTKWTTNMYGLTSLMLAGADHDITGAAFSTFLRNISVESTLEILEFGGEPIDVFDIWDLTDPPTPKLELPRLKEVRFADCNLSLVCEVFIYIEAPNLEILDVFARPDSITWDRGEYFINMSRPFSCPEQHPKLHTFRFAGSYSIGAYMTHIRSCEHLVVSGIHDIAGTLGRLGTFHDDVSSVRDLSTVEWGDEGPPPLVGGWFCPRLLSLEIYHCDGLDPNQLRNLLAARQSAAGPGSPVNTISSLIVHDEYELPGDDRAWFEANLVAFQWVRSDRPASPAPASPNPRDSVTWSETDAAEESEPASP